MSRAQSLPSEPQPVPGAARPPLLRVLRGRTALAASPLCPHRRCPALQARPIFLPSLSRRTLPPLSMCGHAALWAWDPGLLGLLAGAEPAAGWAGHRPSQSVP